MTIQMNKHIKALEDNNAELNSKINDEDFFKRYPHPERKQKEMRDRLQALEEVLALTKFVHKFHKDNC